MRIAMVSTPYVSVPPKGYGGTELIVHLLTEGLVKRGHDVTLYATGDSTTSAKLKYLFERPVWPPTHVYLNPVVEIDHGSWAIQDAIESGADVVHLHCPLALSLQRFSDIPAIYTIHHVWEKEFYNYYLNFPNTHYVAISDFQKNKHTGLNIRTIHHGLNLERFEFNRNKDDYLLFLGRIASVKGVHLAMDAAIEAGVRLKIAGDIQPIHRNYFENEVKPRLDSDLIEYVGEADHFMKVELLKNAAALLFPIQWDEPFGLVMIESMACGTPVIAFPYGSVPEVIEDGVSGYIVQDLAGMVEKINQLNRLSPDTVRDYVERYFSVDRMVEQYEATYLHAAATRTGLKAAKKVA